MKSNASKDDEKIDVGPNNTRRELLQKTAAIGATGALGLGASSAPAAALHCGGEDDSNYEQEESIASVLYEQGLELVTGTTLAHMGTYTSNGTVAHTFYFNTNAVSQYEYDQDPVHAVGGHEVRLDSTAISSSVLDFCQPYTGIYPSGNATETDDDFFALADLAYTAMDAYTGLGVPLLSASTFQDSYSENFNDPQNQSFSLLRKFTVEDQTRVQGSFEVNHDVGDAGRVKLESETELYRSSMSGGPHLKADHFWIYCSDDFVSIDTEPPGSP